jgi:ribulose kinase
MQIKADVSNCYFDVPQSAEATMLGSAMVATIGCGFYMNEEEAYSSIKRNEVQTVVPDPDQHQHQHRVYKQVFECSYLNLQKPLREYYKTFFENR